MATYYVSPTGTYSAPGTYADPWDIARLIDEVWTTGSITAGDTAVFKNGTYSLTSYIGIWKNGTSGNPIVFEAETRYQAILDGQNNLTYILYPANTSYLRFQNLSFTRSGFGDNGSAAITSNSGASHYIEIIGNKFYEIARRTITTNYGYGAIFAAPQTHNWLIDGNVFYNIGRTGGSSEWLDQVIYMCGYSHTAINNLFYDPDALGWAGACISISAEYNTNDGDNHLIANNTFVGASRMRHGHVWISWDIDDQLSGTIIANNISRDTTTAFIWPYHASVVGLGGVTARNNITDADSIATQVDTNWDGTGLTLENNLQADPDFVDEVNYDFHLSGSSPAISYAYAPNAPAYDLDRVERPIGEFDSGAYEYEGGFFMATYNKFQDFVEQLCKGVHQLHAAGHTLNVYLTNTTPNVSTHAVKADLAGITEQNGYAAADIQNDFSETGGQVTLTAVDVTWTGTGAGFGPFRYAVIYNDTPTSPADPLVCYYDYGSSISVLAGETFKVDFGASLLTLI